jgi:hypothetical protein
MNELNALKNAQVKVPPLVSVFSDAYALITRTKVSSFHYLHFFLTCILVWKSLVNESFAICE